MAQLYCAICGAPIFTSGYLDSSHIVWLNKVTLLTSAHETENGIELDIYYPTGPFSSLWSYHLGLDPPDEAQRRVLRLDADVEDDDHDNPYFKLAGSGKEVKAMTIEPYRGQPLRRGQGGPLYLPVHRPCLHIADYFVESIDTSMHTFPEKYSGKITSIRQLWEVLSRRLVGHEGRMWGPFSLQEPHDYFGGDLSRFEWEPANEGSYGELLEQNPVEIPSLTESILQNLEPIPTDLPTGEDTDDFQWVNNFRNSELICNYTYSQDWWCKALIKKKMFPWLWDIDKRMICEKQQTGNWNWELLARQLSQIKIHEPHDTSLKIPLRLRNRRRIWRILEEGIVDDVAGPGLRERQAAREERERQWREMPQTQLPAGPPFAAFGFAGFPFSGDSH